MTKKTLVLSAFLLCATSISAWGATPPAPVISPPVVASGKPFNISEGFSQAAEKIVLSVVNISTTQVIEGRQGTPSLPQFAPGSPFEDFFKDFFDQADKPRRVQSLGSGFIVQVSDKEAYVVTNYHVVADANKISVFLHDNTELVATIQGKDERTDIAVLKVNLENLPSEKRQLIPITWGDSQATKVGDWVLAVGNPFGLGSTVTAGIISNRSRNIGGRTPGRAHVSEYVDDFMQHDASINMGNSGGPLCNTDGHVVGINTAIFSPSGGSVGIGFAIPSDVAKATVDQLIAFGKTKRGWLGVRIQNLTDDMSEGLGLGPKARGAIVGSVTPNGPADKAKIEAGDVILSFDGKELNENSRLTRLVGETPVGKTVEVHLWRKGKKITVNVVLGEFEQGGDVSDNTKEKKGDNKTLDYPIVLGLKLSAITPELHHQFKLKETVKGVLVMGIDFNSPGNQVGLRVGDVIVEINQKSVTSPEEFGSIIEDAKKESKKNVLLLINRDGEPAFLPMKLELEDLKAKADSTKK